MRLLSAVISHAKVMESFSTQDPSGSSRISYEIMVTTKSFQAGITLLCPIPCYVVRLLLAFLLVEIDTLARLI
jgi:hypothetical protein